jgi:hypothetical protein
VIVVRIDVVGLDSNVTAKLNDVAFCDASMDLVPVWCLNHRGTNAPSHADSGGGVRVGLSVEGV